MGCSVLLLDALYIVTDIWKKRQGTGLLLLFGQHALFAYVISHGFGRPAHALSRWLAHGLPRLIGSEHELWWRLIASLVTMLSVSLFVAVWRRLVLTEKMRRAKG